MRAWLVLLPIAGLLAACGPKSQVYTEDDADFPHYHHIGVPAFMDRTGQGQAVADAVTAAIDAGISYPIDSKKLDQVLAEYKPDNDWGFGVEAVQMIRAKTGADSIVLGRMAPDWSAAIITMVELDTGAPVLRAVLRPPHKQKKFATPDEVAVEFVKMYSKLR